MKKIIDKIIEKKIELKHKEERPPYSIEGDSWLGDPVEEKKHENNTKH